MPGNAENASPAIFTWFSHGFNNRVNKTAEHQSKWVGSPLPMRLRGFGWSAVSARQNWSSELFRRLRALAMKDAVGFAFPGFFKEGFQHGHAVLRQDTGSDFGAMIQMG